MTDTAQLDQLVINTIRTLSMDAVQAANSGHPGTQAVNAEYETLGQPSVTLEDIKRFRRLDSKAPGHPEYHWLSGVETMHFPASHRQLSTVRLSPKDSEAP